MSMLGFQINKDTVQQAHHRSLDGRLLTDVAFGTSAGASLGAIAGTVLASGIALPVIIPFALAGTAAVVGGALSYSAARHHK